MVQSDRSYIANSLSKHTLIEQLNNLMKDKTQTVNMIFIADFRSTEMRIEIVTAIIIEVDKDSKDEIKINRL